jgi:4-amino-4-deoxychorismate lyase
VPGAEVAELSAAEVSHADALFLCNSVRGILPVRRLGMREWPRDDAIAPLRACWRRATGILTEEH